jgi:3,4-dihydroxy 2-butanone 4-phosphate synthase/GTP cyclohydrolase II
MARMPDLERFAEQHGLLLLTIADLIQYRMQTERLVRRVSEASIALDLTGTEWRAIAYEILGESREFLALVKGTPKTDEPVLVRVHSGAVVGDVFSSTSSDGGANLRASLQRIESEGAGVVLYIPPSGSVGAELLRRQGSSDTRVDGPTEPRAHASVARGNSVLREFGLGAQVLADLGITELRLLTNSSTKIAGLDGFGLRVTERVAVQAS